MRKTVALSKQYEIMDNILAERKETIIPQIMQEYGFDMWVVLCREYNEDPIYTTMVPALCLSARRLSCLVFTMENGKFASYNFGKPSDLINSLYIQGYTDGNISQFEALANFITAHNPQKIGINTSTVSGMGDGISKQLYDDFTACLTAEQISKLHSAYNLSTRWIETRLPEELSRYRSVYALAMDICAEAFSTAVITPGVTTTTEVEQWIAQEINNLGLTFWFSPHVDAQRKGMSGGGKTGIIIQHGDLLHYDVGIKYFGLCTDSQRLGYVLREGETEIPSGIMAGFAKTSRFQDIVCDEHIIGKTGNEILASSLARANSENIDAMLYNHPIGFFGHSAGTIVGLWDMQGGIGEKGDFPLHPNTCYALELNTQSAVPEWDNQIVKFSAEESVAFTENHKMSYMAEGRDKIFIIK